MTLISGASGGMGETGRKYPSNGVDYPLHFFNLLHFDRPRNLNEVFKWCIKLSEAHGLLDRITDTMSRYPITQIVVTNDIGGENKDFWANLLNNTLNMPDQLVRNGKDYYTFGNCIASIVPPFKRYLICPKCSTYMRHCINDDNAEEKQFEWKFRDYKFYGKCSNKECKYNGVMEVKDEFLKGEDFIKKLTIHRWPVQHIKIRNLSICGKKRIYYRLEDKYRKPIITGDRFVVANVPYTFILAVKQNQNAAVIELPSELTFHYEHESITEPEWEGLSKPFFFSVWKDVFMSFILRKAQECIASDHLLPNRFIFPTTAPGGRDPLSQLDGGSWVSSVTTILKRQQNDPNEIGVVPGPLGYQALGGQGKAMSLREEIELQDRRILTQMGIPPELIYGGMTWSGSNVALRMLENLFIYYINKQNRFIQFFVDYAAKMSGKAAPTDVKLSPFKMADDIQQQNLLIALGAQGRISETTSLSQVGNGINMEEEAKQAETEATSVKRIMAAKQTNTAKVSNDVNKIMAEGQAEAQIDGQIKSNQAGTAAQSGVVNGAVMQSVQGIVNSFLKLDIPNRQQALIELMRQNPQQYNAVVSRLNGIQSQPDQPLPTVKPPRRGVETAKV